MISYKKFRVKNKVKRLFYADISEKQGKYYQFLNI